MVPYALLLVFLGIANWLATTILVEAEVTRDYRDWIGRKSDKYVTVPGHFWFKAWAWYKLKYLVGCHLCTGIWVGVVMAAFIAPVISTPVVGFAFTALIIKGIGHLTLVLHKLGEAVATRLNAQTEWSKFDLEQRRNGEW